MGMTPICPSCNAPVRDSLGRYSTVNERRKIVEVARQMWAEMPDRLWRFPL